MRPAESITIAPTTSAAPATLRRLGRGREIGARKRLSDARPDEGRAAWNDELSAVLRALPDLYFLLNGERRFVQYSAGKGAKLYVPPDEFLGKRFDAVLPPHVVPGMTAAIDRAHGRPGMRRLTAAVALLSEDGERFRSSTERDVRDRLRAAGFPRALINADRVLADGSRHELDLWWPQQRLNVEIDGPRHRLPHQRALDRARDRKLAAEGVQVVRVPVEDIDAHFATVAAEIAWRLGCVTLSAR